MYYGYECTTLAMQVLGGHGYITEWGLEQYVRDSRINMIYEGTNTVQALDLLGRKVLSDMGARLMKFDKVVHDVIKANAERPAMKDFTAPLAELAAEVRKVTMEIGQKALQNPDEVGAAADPYLRLVGHLVFSFAWCYSAGVAMKLMASDPTKAADPFYKAKVATARFYFAKLYPETAALLRKIRAGSEALMALDAEAF